MTVCKFEKKIDNSMWVRRGGKDDRRVGAQENRDQEMGGVRAGDGTPKRAASGRVMRERD